MRQSDANLNAQDLAKALSTSERTLHRKLKQACGESPKSFIDRIRVETARTLLETSEKPVKELAASAGFIDEASFRRALALVSARRGHEFRLSDVPAEDAEVVMIVEAWFGGIEAGNADDLAGTHLQADLAQQRAPQPRPLPRDPARMPSTPVRPRAGAPL